MRKLMLATTMLLGFVGIGHAETQNVSRSEINRIYSHFNKCVAANVTPNNAAVQMDVAIVVDGNGSTRRAYLEGDAVKRMPDPEFRAYAAQVIRAVMTQDCATLQMPDSLRGTTMRFIVQIDPPHAPAETQVDATQTPTVTRQSPVVPATPTAGWVKNEQGIVPDNDPEQRLSSRVMLLSLIINNCKNSVSAQAESIVYDAMHFAELQGISHARAVEIANTEIATEYEEGPNTCRTANMTMLNIVDELRGRGFKF